MAKSKVNLNQGRAQTQAKAPADTKKDSCASHGHGHDSTSSTTATTGAKSQAALSELENELNSREIAIIEREIKSLRLQEEVDRLRPLSGLYRVVKAMATERRLDSLLDTITRETQSIVKCDRCSVFVLDHDKSELWTQVAQGLTGVRTIRIPLAGAAIVSHCARAGRIINIPDAQP
jgi:transcriptional regulator with GAF, ATPase, and Fis domain